MAKASRSKSRLPEFDPGELEDLIFSPAVGSGVGSHLLTPEATTEVKLDKTIVGSTPTIVEAVMATVADKEMTTVAESASIVVCEPPIVVESELSTVVSLPSIPLSLWLSEAGEIVPASRVRRIRMAQDVLSPAEEAVYTTLWDLNGGTGQEHESHRIAQAGYDFLMKRTHLSKKTIQRIVDRLIDKGFIAIERPADIYQRTSTVYRVYAYREVLERQAQNGRFHVAKIGPGFVYVREVATSNMSTVVIPATDRM
jgi:predicted transcriptional regulator